MEVTDRLFLFLSFYLDFPSLFSFLHFCYLYLSTFRFLSYQIRFLSLLTSFLTFPLFLEGDREAPEEFAKNTEIF